VDKHQKVYLEILDENFKEIASPFLSMLSDSIQKLTRTEIQIISLIKQNKITKEIAELMGSLNERWKHIETISERNLA
jgi:hypothetical protein